MSLSARPVAYWLVLSQITSTPNAAASTAPATISLGILAVALWHERAQTSVWARRFAVAAVASGAITGEDAAVGRQLGVAERLEQRRHQLSPRQVAGAAEENEVEGHAERIRCRAGPTGRTRPRDDGRSGADR